MNFTLRQAVMLIPGILCFGGCTPCRQVRIDSEPPGARISVRREMAGMWPAPGFVWDEIGVAPCAVDSCSLAPDMKARLNSHELPLYYHHGTEAIIFDFENDQAREIPSSPEE